MNWMVERIAEWNTWIGQQPDLKQSPLPVVGPEQGVYNVYIQVISLMPDREDAPDRVVMASWKALEILAHGHEAFIRGTPVAQLDHDFATTKTDVWASVRFSVCDNEGEWHFPDPSRAMFVSYGQ